MVNITIVGYEKGGKCEHCGRVLKHGIRISDGRIVGAQCLNKQLTKPRTYQGKKYRFGAEHIIKIAKVVEYKTPFEWSRYGVSVQSTIFEAV